MANAYEHGPPNRHGGPTGHRDGQGRRGVLVNFREEGTTEDEEPKEPVSPDSKGEPEVEAPSEDAAVDGAEDEQEEEDSGVSLPNPEEEIQIQSQREN